MFAKIYSRLDSLLALAGHIRREIKEMSEALNKLKADVGAAVAEISELKAENAALKKDNADKDAKIAELSTELANAQGTPDSDLVALDAELVAVLPAPEAPSAA